MKCKIHRGTNEIGGSCVELSTGKTRILIDAGLPLSGEAYSLPSDVDSVDAVLISHPHMDHYGLLEQVPRNIPIYMGGLGQRMIHASRIFNAMPMLNNTFVTIENHRPILIGDFEVTPYLVDHSAPDSYAFLVKGKGKAVFYSGDFRAHGRKARLYDQLLKNPPSPVDVLIMEGTMINRDNHPYQDEVSVEMGMQDAMKSENGPCFLLCSSQNIDRIVSAYKACIKVNRKFVVDIYTAWILHEFSLFSSHVPTINWENVRVLSKGWTASRHYGIVKNTPEYFQDFVHELYKPGNAITIENLKHDPKKYLIKSSYVDKLFKEMACTHATVIYSMWKGYLQQDHNNRGFKKYQLLQNNKGITFVTIHTSGHAQIDDLKRLAEALQPRLIVPIHTEHKDMYKEYFDNVHKLDDGEVLDLSEEKKNQVLKIKN